jgi:hypothetical protein
MPCGPAATHGQLAESGYQRVTVAVNFKLKFATTTSGRRGTHPDLKDGFIEVDAGP